MSMLHIGASCNSCNLVDFLPTLCPSCSQTYCQSHILSHHPCFTTSLRPETNPTAGPSTFAPKAKCDVRGCERVRIEAIGGLESEREGKGAGIGKEIRCTGCQGAFCVLHRAQVDHDCTAPLAHLTEQDAAASRRLRAQEILKANFSDTKSRIIGPIPVQKDIERKRPISPPRLPPSLLPPETRKVEERAVPKRVKTKDEKIWDIHLRKIRSLAKPLDGRDGGDSRSKRFFEWGVDETGGGIEVWLNAGKLEVKTEKVWVYTETPIGKILDMLIVKSKISRPVTLEDTKHVLSLLNLVALPNQPRRVVAMNLAHPADSFEEGTIVLLTRGYSGVA